MSQKRKYFYLTVANSIFVIHTMFVVVVLVGWAIPGVFSVYVPVLISSLISELMLGYCVLTKWEFGIRRKIYPDMHFEYSFIMHYTRKFLNLKKPDGSTKKSIKFGGYGFVLILILFFSLSLVFNLFIYT